MDRESSEMTVESETATTRSFRRRRGGGGGGGGGGDLADDAGGVLTCRDVVDGICEEVVSACMDADHPLAQPAGESLLIEKDVVR
jgi:hypothetical protein